MRLRLAIAAIASALTLTTAMPGIATADTAERSQEPVPGTTVDSDCPVIPPETIHAPYAFRYPLTDKEVKERFLSAQTGLAKSGYRPTRLAGFESNGEIRYAIRMIKAAGPEWRASVGLTGAQFDAEFQALKAQWRPIDVSGFNTPDGYRYNLVWERNLAGVVWKLFRIKTRAEMQDLVDLHKVQGYVPERVEGYRVGTDSLRFVSTWRYMPSCDWNMHNNMSLTAYKDLFDDYVLAGYRQVHVDATLVRGEMRYHAIWWKQPGPAWNVFVDRDWYLFQRIDNNMWCAGFPATNFYVADNGSGFRLGAIWTFSSAVAIDDQSPLRDRVQEEVNCAPGRAGAAVLNVTTGASVQTLGDQIFSMSSTGKPAAALAVLQKAQADGDDIDEYLLNVGTQYGANQGPDLGGPGNGPLLENQLYSLRYLMQVMIDNSSNWAFNRLVADYLGGLDALNDTLADLGLEHTRFGRYMNGTGAPSAHGTTGPSGDYEAGWDNLTTPLEWVQFLRLVHENDGVLSAAGYADFWALMDLNGAGSASMMEAGLGEDWADQYDGFAKAGSNHWGWDTSVNPWVSTASVGDYAHRPQIGSHVQRSEGGRLMFANGQVAFYAVFVNEGTNVDTDAPVDDVVDCIVVEVVREYSGVTTGDELPQCK